MVTENPKGNWHIESSETDGTLICLSRDVDQDMKLIKRLFDVIATCPEVENAAQAHKELRDSTRKTQGELEDFLLMHHVPGTCRLCRKLGAL